MNEQVAWYLARSTGLVSWALLTLSVVWGLLLHTRLTGRRPTPRWLLDLHRFLGGLSVGFVGLHLVGVMADSYVHFGLADLFVPFAAAWRPGAVALGVVALYLLMAVEISSVMMRRLPKPWWRGIHMSSYGAFLLATWHAISAGTDATNPVFVVAVNLALAAVLFLTLVRGLAGRGRRSAGGQRDRGTAALGSGATERAPAPNP